MPTIKIQDIRTDRQNWYVMIRKDSREFPTTRHYCGRTLDWEVAYAFLKQCAERCYDQSYILMVSSQELRGIYTPRELGAYAPNPREWLQESALQLSEEA